MLINLGMELGQICYLRLKNQIQYTLCISLFTKIKP